MYKLMDGVNIVASSANPIEYSAGEKSWKVDNNWHYDPEKKYTRKLLKVSRVVFKMLFSPDEGAAITTIRNAGTDGKVDYYYSVLEDPDLAEIDLSLPFTIAAVTYMINLVGSGLSYTPEVNAARIDQILSGISV